MISKDHHWGGVEADPDNYFGFIYIIESRLGRKYIGKKQYFLSANRKQKITDRQSSQWKDELWKESDWKTYTGSSKELNKDIKKYGKEIFLFTILRNCRSKGDLHYAEIEEQVKRNVLKEKSENGEYVYYNKSIAAIRFRPPDFASEETREKLRKHLKENGHPLQGKPHPNKGKRLPQCAPKSCKAAESIKITDGVVNKWWPKDDPIPDGWERGQSNSKRHTKTDAVVVANKKVAEINSERHRKRYEAAPKFCRECGCVLEFEKRHWKTCSEECRSKDRSKISIRSNKERKEANV